MAKGSSDYKKVRKRWFFNEMNNLMNDNLDWMFFCGTKNGSSIGIA